jgi:hypothetical protein
MSLKHLEQRALQLLIETIEIENIGENDGDGVARVTIKMTNEIDLVEANEEIRCREKKEGK